MASYYVRSGAAGAGTGADWANAYTTLAAAFSGKTAGDSFYVSEDHAESQAGALRLASPGTSAAPCLVYCVNHSGSVPPVSADLRTTATITCSASANLDIDGFTYYYGISFVTGAGGATGGDLRLSVLASSSLRLDSCLLCINGTNNKKMLFGTGTGGRTNFILLNNTPLKFGASNQGVNTQNATLRWINTLSAIQGTIPSPLFTETGNNTLGDIVVADGVDLSASGAGNTLIGALPSAMSITLIRCKLGASVTIAAPTSRGGGRVDAIQCDSGATNYRDERYWYEGTQSVETTIVRTGGATDGATPISWKLVTTANSKWLFPFESQPIAIWNESTGSITVTIYGIWGGGAVPNNDDIWIEAEYLGSALTPLGSFINDTKADNLAAGSALASDSSAWGGSTTAFKMTATFTPGMKGPINIVVKAAKASTTFYIDPKPEISGVTVSKSAILAPGVYANELSSGAAAVKFRASMSGNL